MGSFGFRQCGVVSAAFSLSPALPRACASHIAHTLNIFARTFFFSLSFFPPLSFFLPFLHFPGVGGTQVSESESEPAAAAAAGAATAGKKSDAAESAAESAADEGG